MPRTYTIHKDKRLVVTTATGVVTFAESMANEARQGHPAGRRRNVNEIIAKLSPRQRRKVETRAAQLLAEELTLRQLRQARKLTQQKIARSLHIGQEGVSKLERRSDLLILTLRDYVEAMGGSLSLVAEFPDREPVVLSGIAGDEPDRKSARRKRAYAGA